MNAGRRWVSVLLRAGAIAAASFWAYGPALRGSWVWDDDVEIGQNRALRDPAGWWHAWVRPSGQDYFPLKASLQWVEWRWWGDHVLGYHLVNLTLHVLGAWLVWRLLARLGARLGWVGGLVFALHPLAVESAAWIAEFKNVLSLPLLLGAMLAYLRFDATRRAGPYLEALALFLLALLAKSTVVMLPAVILLHAWWKRGRIGAADLRAAAPFGVLAAFLGAITLKFQAERAIAGVRVVTAGVGARLAGAGTSILFYLRQALWPDRLMPIYPHLPDAQLWRGLWAWAALALAAAVLARRGGPVGRTVLLGLGFFALNLAPVLGIVPMAFDRLAWVADHLCYISLVGIAGLAAAAAEAAWARRPAWAATGVLLVAAALAAATKAQATTYRDPEVLWSRAVRLNPSSALAWNNFGIALADRSRDAEAIAPYKAALRLDPRSAEFRTNLANSLERVGRPVEAEAQYREAVRLNPHFWGAHLNLGKALSSSGRTREAIAEYQEAVRLNPEYPAGLYELANLLAGAGQPEAAAAWYARAVALDPGQADAHLNYGNVLAELGRAPEAIAEYQAVLRLQPEAADVRNNLGSLLAEAGRYPEARAQFEEALRLKPDYAEARDNLRRLAGLESHGP